MSARRTPRLGSTCETEQDRGWHGRVLGHSGMIESDYYLFFFLWEGRVG